MSEPAHAEQFAVETGRATILVVDDDPIMVDLACEQLGAHGHETIGAGDGADALECLNSRPFDLIVCDIKMPGMNGFELIETVRRSSAHRFMPIVVVTTLNDMESVERAFGAGATTFVTKPVNWPLFAHEVRYVLRAAALEAELREARDRAEQLVEQKDSFLSVLSHELRTPLNAIIGFAEILSAQSGDPAANPHYRSYLEEILNGGRRLLGTLHDLFVYSRILSGDMVVNEGDYSLQALAREVGSMVAGRVAAGDVRLDMTGFGESDAMRCDLNLLGRALGGIVDNALKFSPPGGVVSVEAEVARDGRRSISVHDRGPGMSAEEAAGYLAPFTQSDMSLRRSVEGLGLGLTIADMAVRLHGGELSFEKRPDGGTTVRISLPGNARKEARS